MSAVPFTLHASYDACACNASESVTQTFHSRAGGRDRPRLLAARSPLERVSRRGNSWRHRSLKRKTFGKENKNFHSLSSSLLSTPNSRVRVFKFFFAVKTSRLSFLATTFVLGKMTNGEKSRNWITLRGWQHHRSVSLWESREGSIIAAFADEQFLMRFFCLHSQTDKPSAVFSSLPLSLDVNTPRHTNAHSKALSATLHHHSAILLWTSNPFTDRRKSKNN